MLQGWLNKLIFIGKPERVNDGNPLFKNCHLSLTNKNKIVEIIWRGAVHHYRNASKGEGVCLGVTPGQKVSGIKASEWELKIIKIALPPIVCNCFTDLSLETVSLLKVTCFRHNKATFRKGITKSKQKCVFKLTKILVFVTGKKSASRGPWNQWRTHRNMIVEGQMLKRNKVG